MSWISSAQGQTSPRASAKKGRAIGLDRKMRVAPLLLNLVRLRCTLWVHRDGGLLSCVPNTRLAQEGLHNSVPSCHKPPEQQSGTKRLPCCNRDMGFAEGSLRALGLSLYLVALKQGSFSNRLWDPRCYRSYRGAKASVITVCTAVTCFFTTASLQISGMSNWDNLGSSQDSVGPCQGDTTGLRGLVNTRVVNICHVPRCQRLPIHLYCSSQTDFLVFSLHPTCIVFHAQFSSSSS